MSVKSNDTNLSELLNMVETGKAQLPDFQRSWVWDDKKICKLIESITSGFPMGAAMLLENDDNSKNFLCRKFTGVDKNISVKPDYLVLDGQQRLTTLFQVFKSKNPVETCSDTNKDNKIKRYYYLDIRKALDANVDRLDAILSVPANKRITENIGRDVKIDLTTADEEYRQLLFPLNIVFSTSDMNAWMLGLVTYFKDETVKYIALYNDFCKMIINQITSYQIPVITLTKDTSKEAVCQIFENVNTGGVSLTVFELVTATFAMYGTKLRDEWDEIQDSFKELRTNVLKDVDGTAFITAMTLLTNYYKSKQGTASVSCKKKDVLKLELSDFKKYKDSLKKGFISAANFLSQQGIYSECDLPYGTQLIPLAAIFSYDSDNGNLLSISTNKEKLCKWYWCGVFGELYGSANETRYALDMTGIFDWINGVQQPDTVTRANFEATRLLSMQTRNSAAYKGVLALIMQDSPLDFMSANRMDIASYSNESTDIHHIFPKTYCISKSFSKDKWDSVINKTLIYASTNRSIGGRAPSEYIKTMENKGLNEQQIDEAIASHFINPQLLRTDAFDDFIVDRAIRLLDRIEIAMGKATSGRESEDTIREFGADLKKIREINEVSDFESC